MSSKYPLGKKVFISHRGDDYGTAVQLKSTLLHSNYCKRVVLFENESLCANWEQLLVIEYFQLMEGIIDRLTECTSFLFIESPNYVNGYFTQAEILQWRRFKKQPLVIPVFRDVNNNFQLRQPILLQPFSKRDKKLWAKISVNIHPVMKGRRQVFWGKYARNCFIIGCCICGEYFLLTRKFMDILIGTGLQVKCPHCLNAGFDLYEDRTKRKYFKRHPIILRPKVQPRQLRHLTESEILHLLTGNNLPSRIRILKAPNEKLTKDSSRAMKGYLVSIGILAAILAGLGLADWLQDDGN
ncbi:MAG: hypothetical protein AAFO03_00465 [Bacteroidota bacterium]